MADATRKPLHPSLPANYVSFLDLRDRWMKQQQLKDRERKEREEIQPIVENVHDELQLPTVEVLQADVERVEAVVGEDKSFVADHRLESDSPPQPAGESVVRSNPNPKNAARRPFHGHRRPAERGNHHRWIQVSPTKSPPALPLNKPNHAPKIQAIQSEPAPVVPVDPKALPVLHADLSKPPPSETPKADHAVKVPTEIHSSDKEVSNRRFGRGKMKQALRGKKNQKKNRNEDLVQSQPEKDVLAPNRDLEERANPKVQLEPKAQPLKDPKVVRSVQPRDEIHGSAEVVNDANLDRAKTKKTKSKNKKKRRNQKAEDVIESQPKKDTLFPNVDLDETENSKQEIEAVRENTDAAENLKAEIEGKFAALSVSGAPEESSSHRSVAARNRRGWRKNGSFAKFESRVILKQERAKMESGLVWVKKGEASQIGAVPVLKSSKMRM